MFFLFDSVLLQIPAFAAQGKSLLSFVLHPPGSELSRGDVTGTELAESLHPHPMPGNDHTQHPEQCQFPVPVPPSPATVVCTPEPVLVDSGDLPLTALLSRQ